MKKHIAIVLSLALMTVELVSANFVCNQETVNESAEETIEKDVPIILTKENLSSLYSCKEDVRVNNPSILEVDQIDADIVMKIGRQEGGPTLDGQLWAIRVIFNRLFSGDFDDTVWNVVSAEGQFDVFTNGSYINAEVNENTHIALAMIEGGWDETEGALYWRAEEGHEGSWHDRKLEYVATIAGNRYYK